VGVEKNENKVSSVLNIAGSDYFYSQDVKYKKFFKLFIFGAFVTKIIKNALVSFVMSVRIYQFGNRSTQYK